MTDASTTPHEIAGEGTNPPAMIYVRDKDSEGVVRQCLQDLGVNDAVYRPGGVDAAIAEMSNQGGLKLLIVDVDASEGALASITRLLAVCSPSTGVIVLGESNDLSFYRHLREAGVAEYVFKPLVSSLLIKACNRVLTGAHEREGAPTGELIFVMGVRGGAGATTIAVRTAWQLAQSPPRPVVLLDLDTWFGDAALQLDAAPNQTLDEALQDVGRVDDLFLERGVIHVTKQLDLLASLDSLRQPLEAGDDAIIGLFERLMRRYRYVVVDVPALVAAYLPRLLQMPSTLLLVSDGRLVSARDVRRWRELVGANSLHRSTQHILNRSGAPGSLPREDFERAAGQAPDATIPEAREISVATNLGIHAKPVCPELERGLSQVLQRITGAPAAREPSILSRLLG